MLPIKMAGESAKARTGKNMAEIFMRVNPVDWARCLNRLPRARAVDALIGLDKGQLAKVIAAVAPQISQAPVAIGLIAETLCYRVPGEIVGILDGALRTQCLSGAESSPVDLQQLKEVFIYDVLVMVKRQGALQTLSLVLTDPAFSQSAVGIMRAGQMVKPDRFSSSDYGDLFVLLPTDVRREIIGLPGMGGERAEFPAD
jgi:hypothetical protein